MRLGPLIRWTIKARIAIAFLAMSGACLALGGMTVMSAHRADRIVRMTYDNILIADSYARAAANDFANLRTDVERQQRLGHGHRDRLDTVGSALHASFQADVATAAEKADWPEVTGCADDLRQAEIEWRTASRNFERATGPDEDLADLETRTSAVEEKIEAMVSAVTSRGLAFRAKAQADVDHDIQLALAGIGATILIGALAAITLSRRISGPLGEAVRFARDIAAGALQGDPPRAHSDEIGDLIRAMVSMRGDIAAMMDEQIVLREQSQARIADALEGSHEGVVVVDPRGVIQIANRRALDWLGMSKDRVAAGDTVAGLIGRMGRSGSTRPALLQMRGSVPEIEESQLSDGRWIRSSRHRTAEGGLVALFTEITAIKDQQDRLAEANLTLDAALHNMSQGLCLFDPNDCLKLANSRFRALFGLSEDICRPGTPYRDIVAQVLVGAGGTTFGLDRLMRHEGAVIRRRRSINRSVALGGRTIAIAQQPMAEGGWLATYEDVTERKRAEAQIAFLANHDALTHLPNRSTFGKRVEAEALLRRGGSFAVLCIDLDHFKQVNDTLGHALGDELLRAVTNRLLDCVRSGDTVARLGGDEFAILQHDITGPEQVAALAGRVVRSLSDPYVIEGHEINVAASIGIALSPHDGRTHGVLLKSADAALYKAKEDGRRTWRFFELAMDETLQARHALEVDLRRAVQNHEFEVFFQPLLEARSSQIRSFEALVRWHHPTRGLVTPDDFIPVAEEMGAIKEIGRWVLVQSCREAVRWPPHMRVAVNVSTIQLREADFIDVVTDALAASGLSPDRLELEITESVFMANTNRIMPLLTSLRGIGVRFAIDDFGTGYSSLSTLRAFPFDKIKIDRSFVRDMVVAEAAGQIIRTILALGKSLGMSVTAEGVETRSQLHFLEEAGCDEIQGYLVGRPMPAGEVIERLARDSDRGWIERAA